MDLKTSFIFYFVCLALYAVMLTSMALVDRRVVGARWLAYSVLIELVKVVLQVMGGTLPRVLSTMVVNELNVVAYFSMYVGFHWFVLRGPLRRRTGPIALLVLMAVYAGMFVLHVPYAFQVITLPVLWICGATVRLVLAQKEERFRMPARFTAALLLAHMGLVVYRMALAVELYRHTSDWRPALNDPRWLYSMLFIILLSNCVLIMYVWFAAAEMYCAVEVTAGQDALTGCLNRRALMKLAAHEMARSERTGMPLAIVAVDIDHFKAVNDTYGHGGGDAVLCALVNLLQQRLRAVDVVARTGGEEFLLLLPDTDAVDTSGVVAELLRAVRCMRVEYDDCSIGITLSAGITQRLPRNDTWTAMMHRADSALYAAKAAGRDCLHLDEQVLQLPRRVVAARDEVVSIAEGRAEGWSLRVMGKKRG